MFFFLRERVKGKVFNKLGKEKSCKSSLLLFSRFNIFKLLPPRSFTKINEEGKTFLV